MQQPLTARERLRLSSTYRRVRSGEYESDCPADALSIRPGDRFCYDEENSPYFYETPRGVGCCRARGSAAALSVRPPARLGLAAAPPSRGESRAAAGASARTPSPIPPLERPGAFAPAFGASAIERRIERKRAVSPLPVGLPPLEPAFPFAYGARPAAAAAAAPSVKQERAPPGVKIEAKEEAEPEREARWAAVPLAEPEQLIAPGAFVPGFIPPFGASYGAFGAPSPFAARYGGAGASFGPGFGPGLGLGSAPALGLGLGLGAAPAGSPAQQAAQALVQLMPKRDRVAAIVAEEKKARQLTPDEVKALRVLLQSLPAPALAQRTAQTIASRWSLANIERGIAGLMARRERSRSRQEQKRTENTLIRLAQSFAASQTARGAVESLLAVDNDVPLQATTLYNIRVGPFATERQPTLVTEPLRGTVISITPDRSAADVRLNSQISAPGSRREPPLLAKGAIITLRQTYGPAGAQWAYVTPPPNQVTITLAAAGAQGPSETEYGPARTARRRPTASPYAYPGSSSSSTGAGSQSKRR